MEIERAHEIVSAINDRCFFSIGLKESAASLEGVTLADMIAAKRLIEAKNAAAESVSGSRTISMVPDDRLIAAAYCMEHYPMSGEAIITAPATRAERFSYETELKALAIVPARSDEEGDDDA